MQKRWNFAGMIKETGILTAAVAIIAAAVYFFLVPSHASVSSISGLGIVVSYTASAVRDYDDPECGFIGDRFSYLWKGIWGKDSLYEHYAAVVSGDV